MVDEMEEFYKRARGGALEEALRQESLKVQQKEIEDARRTGVYGGMSVGTDADRRKARGWDCKNPMCRATMPFEESVCRFCGWARGKTR